MMVKRKSYRNQCINLMQWLDYRDCDEGHHDLQGVLFSLRECLVFSVMDKEKKSCLKLRNCTSLGMSIDIEIFD